MLWGIVENIQGPYNLIFWRLQINGRRINRRDFVKAGAAAAGAALLGDLLLSCTAGQKRHQVPMEEDRMVIDLDQFPFLKEEWGGGIFVSGKKMGAVVIHTPDGYAAFKPNCTHKKCVVDWKPEEKVFLCPCHKSRFNPDGTVHTGPALFPLPPYPVVEKEGKLIIG